MNDTTRLVMLGVISVIILSGAAFSLLENKEPGSPLSTQSSPSLNETTGTTSMVVENTVTESNQDSSCSFDFLIYEDSTDLEVPSLPKNLTWEPLTQEEAEQHRRHMLHYTPEREFPQTNSLKNIRGWRATHVYQDISNFAEAPSLTEYESELKSRGWLFSVNVHGYEIGGLLADGMAGHIVTYLKLIGDKLRAVTIEERSFFIQDPNKEPMEDIIGIERISYSLYISEITSIYELLPDYKPGTYLGVGYSVVTPEVPSTERLSVNYGVIVTELPLYSPAQQAGLQVGDIILSVNKEEIGAQNSLTSILERYCPNDTVTLRVLSANKEKNIEVTLGVY